MTDPATAQTKSPPAARLTGLCHTPPSKLIEVIVHAGTNGVEAVVPVITFTLRSSVVQIAVECRHADGCVGTKINVKIFDLRRPTSREHPFSARASGPSGLGLICRDGIIEDIPRIYLGRVPRVAYLAIS